MSGVATTPAAPTHVRRHPVRWIALGLGVTMLMVIGVALGTNLDRNTDPSRARSPLIGKPAPHFELPGLDGGTVSSSDLAGRPYVINFWASWCVPCRNEAPHLQNFATRYAADGIALIGIVWNDDRNSARRFRDEFALTYPQVTDPGNRVALSYGVYGVPETYLVDANGIVMAKLVGAVGPDTLDEVLAEVLAGEQYTSKNDRYRSVPEP